MDRSLLPFLLMLLRHPMGQQLIAHLFRGQQPQAMQRPINPPTFGGLAPRQTGYTGSPILQGRYGAGGQSARGNPNQGGWNGTQGSTLTNAQAGYEMPSFGGLSLRGGGLR